MLKGPAESAPHGHGNDDGELVGDILSFVDMSLVEVSYSYHVGSQPQRYTFDMIRGGWEARELRAIERNLPVGLRSPIRGISKVLITVTSALLDQGIAEALYHLGRFHVYQFVTAPLC